MHRIISKTYKNTCRWYNNYHKTRRGHGPRVGVAYDSRRETGRGWELGRRQTLEFETQRESGGERSLGAVKLDEGGSRSSTASP